MVLLDSGNFLRSHLLGNIEASGLRLVVFETAKTTVFDLQPFTVSLAFHP